MSGDVLILASVPSPPNPYLNVGPLMVHWYMIMVLLGVTVAVLLGRRWWAACGQDPDAVVDVAGFAVPFGILGGRLYHVITSWLASRAW
jgi:prolipoprotein diacylglyceryltransferase